MSDGAQDVDRRFSCEHSAPLMPCSPAARAQTFFDQLAADIRRPSYGVMQADFVKALLLRAQEAGIYAPREP